MTQFRIPLSRSWKLYSEIEKILTGTYYVSTQYTDYELVTRWYSSGHEVADHTMTHVPEPPENEIVGNKLALNAYAGIPFGKMQGFLYDSSVTAVGTDDSWPYTLDNGLFHDCDKGFCNTTIHPGFFELPMSAIMDPNGLPHLMDPYLDDTPEVVEKWLKDNFNRHVTEGKVPFGLYIHPVQLTAIAGRPDPAPRIKMLQDFMDWALSQPNVWFVTSQQLIDWMKNPVPVSQLNTYEPFQCKIPKIGHEICNGLDDTGNGQIDAGLTEYCNFNTEVWNTCYGCPSANPTPQNPVPSGGDRFRVPTTCDTAWWDPIKGECLCNSTTCSYTDLSKIPSTSTGNATSTSGTGSTTGATGSSASSGSKKMWGQGLSVLLTLNVLWILQFLM
ncbi:13647_t:CDS:2 [Acaulospora colombiana]|uniref:13647_t:CDS:1 n=1 Tax=Acaulospora colombiana TaxID=27376 RepID=A0ACA9LAY2_9GLOM|nr:13647_t:CDS:2 [Acaulospora colombiana]